MDNNTTCPVRDTAVNDNAITSSVANSSIVVGSRTTSSNSDNRSDHSGDSSTNSEAMSLRDINLLLKKGSTHARGNGNGWAEGSVRKNAGNGRGEVRSDSTTDTRPDKGMGRVSENAQGSRDDHGRSQSTEGSSLGKNQEIYGSNQRQRFSEDRERNPVRNNRYTKGSTQTTPPTTYTGGLDEAAQLDRNRGTRRTQPKDAWKRWSPQLGISPS